MLRTRLLTIAAIFPLFLLALFYLPNRYWSGLILLFTIVAAHEWARLFDVSQVGSAWYGLATAAIAALLCVDGGLLLPSDRVTQWLCVLALIFWTVAAPFVLVRRAKISSKTLALVLGLIALIPLWAALVKLRSFGPLYVFFSMGIIWLADTAAYFVGRAFGKRKLVPDISPGKTVAGAVGAIAIAIVYALIFVALGQRFGTMSSAGLPMLILGFVVIVILSIIGDLFESWLKRQQGKKDSGSLFPGHGGILDRVDSLTSTMPVVVLALMCCKSLWGIL